MSDWRADWRKQARQSRGKARPSGPTGQHTFVVQKPYCSPARDIILTALQPYGIPISNYAEEEKNTSISAIAKMTRLNLKSFDGLMNLSLGIPIAQEATFSVPKGQANWAEYLLDRTKKLAIVKGRIDRRNERWAGKHGGKMPTPWDAQAGRARAQALAPPPDGQPWIEKDCSKGKQIWQQVNAAVKTAKGKQK